MGQRVSYERYAWFDNEVRSGRLPNASTLARRFEISTKTAQREIEYMRDRIGCPLVYDPCEKGYRYERDDYFLPITYLSSAELSSLVLAKRLLEDVQGGVLCREIEGVIGKISSILKEGASGLEDIENVISIHLVGYVPTSEEVFSRILEACIQARKVFFQYYSPHSNELTERVAHPYHLFNHMGTWHMVAFCEMRKGLRDFVLARIRSFAVLNETFIKPRNLDLKGYLSDSFGLFKGSAWTEAVLLFEPEQARWVKGQMWHKDQKMKERRDGSIELTLPVSDLREIQMEVLKFGAGVRVLRPKTLRDRVAAEIWRMNELYGDGSSA